MDLSGIETSDQFAVRKAKLADMRSTGLDPFAQNWEQSHTSAQAINNFEDSATEQPVIKAAGRLVAIRVMGKASFARILDRDGTLQLYVTRDALGEEGYHFFQKENGFG
ncbi:MAG: hypothetical protein LR015_04550 [Verrucomicrobia bacterium]|nr:hypothetical protein [Verrucomicrobiota bacterium]